MKYTTAILLLMLAYQFSYTQQTNYANNRELNYTSFETKQPNVSNELLAFTPPEFYKHSEFGLQPYNQ